MYSNNKQIHFIYLIRGVASFLVAVAHIYGSNISKLYNSSNNTLFKILLDFVYAGGFGVCMFFLLSGFIIPYSYKNIGSFAIRRIFRIYPVFLLSCFLAYFVNGTLGNIHSYILVSADFFNAPTILNGVDWTLRIEMMFYVFIGIILIKEKLTTKLIFYSSLIMLLINIIMQFTVAPTRPLPLLYSNLLLIGVLFYLYYSKQIDKKNFHRNLVSQVIIYAVIFYCFEKIPYKNTVYPLLAIGGFYTLYTVEYKTKLNILIKWLSNCSYSLYLLHNVIFSSLLKTYKSFVSVTLISHILSWISLFALCTILYYFVEKWFIEQGRVVSKRYFEN